MILEINSLENKEEILNKIKGLGFEVNEINPLEAFVRGEVDTFLDDMKSEDESILNDCEELRSKIVKRCINDNTLITYSDFNSKLWNIIVDEDSKFSK